ncbi:MAG: hypothetical protein AAF990_05470 [Bacteroidota bacterium]
MIRLLVCCLFFLHLAEVCSAQFNTKIGYRAAWVQFDDYNSLLDDFNNERDWLDDTFKDLRLQQAVMMGGRYRWSNIALEFTGIFGFNSTKARGTDPAGNVSFFKQFAYRQAGGSLGVEFFAGLFSVGSSINWENFIVRTSDRSGGRKTEIMKEQGWSAQFFLSISSPRSANLALSLRPYIQLYQNDWDFSPAYEELGVAADKNSIEESMAFGVQVIFYNGK